MEHEARLQAKDLDYTDITEEELRAIAWRAPPGWVKPHWFMEEPHPPTLPMQNDRLEWCLRVLGWSLMELARRVHTNEASVRQWLKGRRLIPNSLAYWLEAEAARMLEGRGVPFGWRDKPTQTQSVENWR